MLHRPRPKSPFRKAFDEWWNAQTVEFTGRTDSRAAWTIFQAGYMAGGRKDLNRYIWPISHHCMGNHLDRSQEASCHRGGLSGRVTRREDPVGGWVLEKLT